MYTLASCLISQCDVISVFGKVFRDDLYIHMNLVLVRLQSAVSICTLRFQFWETAVLEVTVLYTVFFFFCIAKKTYDFKLELTLQAESKCEYPNDVIK